MTPDNRLFAGLSETALYGKPDVWIYRSDDNGLNWFPDDNGIEIAISELNQYVSVLLHIDTTGILWAMVHGAGVFRYNGNIWESINNNLPLNALRGTYLVSDPKNSNRLLLGTEASWIYETRNSGESWNVLPWPENINNLETFPLVYTIVIDTNLLRSLISIYIPSCFN